MQFYLLSHRVNIEKKSETKMFRKLIEKIKSMKVEYLNRSPRGKLLFVRNVGIFVLTLCGLAVLDPKFKVNWYSYAPAVVSTDLLLSFIYTLWYYSEEPLKGILFTPLFGILIPVRHLETYSKISTFVIPYSYLSI